MTPPRYEMEEISIGELKGRPEAESIAPGETRYNTASEEKATDILINAQEEGQRVVVYGHDSNRDLMVEAFTPSHSGYGVRPEWVLNQIDTYGSLSSAIEASIGIEEGGIDFFSIDVFYD